MLKDQMLWKSEKNIQESGMVSSVHAKNVIWRYASILTYIIDNRYTIRWSTAWKKERKIINNLYFIFLGSWIRWKDQNQNQSFETSFKRHGQFNLKRMSRIARKFDQNWQQVTPSTFSMQNWFRKSTIR